MLNVVSHCLYRTKYFTAFTGIFDLYPVIPFQQHHQFQRINAVETKAITKEWLMDMTATTYSYATVTEMTGETLKTVLEDVCDNLFNPDPYYQQGGDMVRAGGLSYTIDIGKPIGSRISDLTLLKTGKPLEATKDYTVAGWASVNEGTEGPAIWDVVMNHIQKKKVVGAGESGRVRVLGA